MQVLRHFPLILAEPCALAIGNFDGLHLGHQALLAKLTQTAKQQQLKSAVMTFEPHPREFFAPDQAPTRLASLREKLERFADAGVDIVYLCRFDKKFATLSSEDFIKKILIQSVNAQTVLVGEDFRFGAGRRGGVADIANGVTLGTMRRMP